MGWSILLDAFAKRVEKPRTWSNRLSMPWLISTGPWSSLALTSTTSCPCRWALLPANRIDVKSPRCRLGLYVGNVTLGTWSPLGMSACSLGTAGMYGRTIAVNRDGSGLLGSFLHRICPYHQLKRITQRKVCEMPPQAFISMPKTHARMQKMQHILLGTKLPDDHAKNPHTNQSHLV